jgi:hypothetical protein
MSWISTNTELTLRVNRFRTTSAAGGAATEKVVGQILNDFQVGGILNVSNKLPSYSTIVPSDQDLLRTVGAYSIQFSTRSSVPFLAGARHRLNLSLTGLLSGLTTSFPTPRGIPGRARSQLFLPGPTENSAPASRGSAPTPPPIVWRRTFAMPVTNNKLWPACDRTSCSRPSRSSAFTYSMRRSWRYARPRR